MPDTPFQPQLDFSPHNNQSLFSDHYLQEILRRTPAWRDMQSPAAAFLVWLRDLYAKERDQLASYKESQLEDNWIKPILNRLGHVWEGQASIPGLTRTIKQPDFALFPDEAARQTAVPHQNTPQYCQDVLALLEAKKWTVNLSKKSGPLPRFDDQNPMYQIDTYLSLSGVTWGVVSNGRFWRLVHKNSSRTLETYFEIDLLAALEAPNDRSALAVATFFWAFFNQSAFTPDAHGSRFLDEALSQSKAYAIALEADLRDNAYRSLEQLIIGFFAGDARLDAQNADHRAQVYQNSLYLLYRLLFLFYGEARALLPMGSPTYKETYSLDQLSRDIAAWRNDLDKQPSTGRRRWDRLQELFRLISGRDAQFNAELGVPRYNGGLFDPDQHPFLEQHFVGDRGLAKAIDYLAYRRVREDGRFQGYQSVDYRTLDVRQLGSIYEGLLEYKVAVATEEMVTVRQKGVETWLPARQSKAAPLDRRQPGELYLTNDKGERKATGSYYTPDYIVEYIVENTLGPLVAQARERVKAQVLSSTGSLSEAERQRQSAKLFVQEILALNVLDPAMGSGHFLVEATNFLARALATDEYAAAQIGPFSENGPISETSDETDLLYWKRRVVEACIYGVDKNPMAVELAKLSLWLKTAAADKPLSFLDHHLQHGDSLIGAWLDDLNKPPISAQKSQVSGEQAALFDESRFTRDASLAVKGVATIERLPTLDIDDVHAKEAAWQDIQRTHVARWRTLADLWVSATFGNAVTPEEYRALAAHLQATHFPGNSEFPGKSEPGSSLLTDAQRNHFLQHPAVTNNDYFHWELAFPEVFFDEYGRSRRAAAGFDAVIGNPPWGAHLDQEARNFTSIRFASVHQRTPDTAKYFIGHSISSLRISGLLGFIVPNNLLFEHEYEKIRNLLLTACRINHVVNLGDSVFKEVTAPSCIIILQNEEDLDYEFRFQDLRETAKHDNFEISQMDYFVVAANDVKGLPGVSFPSNPGALSILKKLNTYCDSLEQATKDIARGIDTGANHVFVLSEEKAFELNIEGRVLHPILLGGDINSHFLPERLAQQIIYTTKTSEPDEIPNTMAYLSLHKKRLSQKREAKKGLIPWYSLHWPRYPELFVSPKIVIRQTADTLIAAVDTKEYYVLNNALVILPKGESDLGSYFLSALLNSKLLRFIYQTLVQEEGRTFAEVKPVNLRRLPVPKINFGKIETKASLAVNDAQILYEQGNTAALLAWATAELAANRNDTIHDLLAHLAEQMIALNQQKQAALEAFWLDLEGVTDAKDFDTLRNKGKHQASLHKAVPATRAFVDESSRSTITLDATLGWNEDAFKGMVKELVGSISGLSKLVQVYREHAPSVTALNQRLTTTDHLIDQIVYKLYNLTPAEIAIVAGG